MSISSSTFFKGTMLVLAAFLHVRTSLGFVGGKTMSRAYPRGSFPFFSSHARVSVKPQTSTLLNLAEMANDTATFRYTEADSRMATTVSLKGKVLNWHADQRHSSITKPHKI
jgi:hypothetical protein